MEYPKTENLYDSNDVNGPGRKRGPEFGFKLPSFEQIARWLVTEKVDGMNMRVVYYPFGVNDSISEPYLKIAGRTDKAQIPGDLLTLMQETFTPETLNAAFGVPTADLTEVDDEAYEFLYANTPEGLAHEYRIVLFGEGFGPGIQKAGQAYGGEKRFILFDVVVNGTWLSFDNVEDVARKLGVPTVPVLCRSCSLEEARALVGASKLQDPDSEHIEGIVARTDPYLFDGRGRLVKFKYKVRDL